jgi:hypothetical protein
LLFTQFSDKILLAKPQDDLDWTFFLTLDFNAVLRVIDPPNKYLIRAIAVHLHAPQSGEWPDCGQALLN